MGLHEPVTGVRINFIQQLNNKTMTKSYLLRKGVLSIMSIAFLLIIQSCGSVPFTGRRQLSLVSSDQILALSLQQYQEYMRTASVDKNSANAEMVKRVGTRIATAVETFYKSNGYESELKNYNWEFSLVKDNSVNAFAMPGGKIVVLEGLLSVTQSEEGLAVVVGHEVAHVIAQHSSERMSQQMALQYGGSIAGGLLGTSIGAQLGQQVFGIGAQLGVMLPYARKQEYEADEIGLIVMALAGYNPEVAVSFWSRMAESSGGASVPAMLSTHPTDQNRINNIKKVLPRAMEYYQGPGKENKNTSKAIKTEASPTVNTKDSKTSKDWTF